MAVVVSVSLVISFITIMVGVIKGQELEVGFYRETCPSAESIVASVVRNAVAANANMAAVLLRLHFHDCFVEGCDASILIDDNNTSQLERLAVGHQGVGGFEVIEEAKKHTEASCPGVVSCADIVALAARDAIAMTNGPTYEVPTGRRDGRVSNMSLAREMPEISDSVEQLKSKFFNKGLSHKDLVLLSAAHTIGTTACFFMTKRLYNFFPGGTGSSDPSIRPDFLPLLKSECPQNGDINARIPIDQGSERRFDKQLLRNIRNGLAVLQSDAKLNDDLATRAVIDSYLGFFAPVFGPSFEADFVDAILRMGRIGVKTGPDGEIRKVCSSFN